MDKGDAHSSQGVPRTSDRAADRGADRLDHILDAAFHAFSTYGFRRTTMDDIARGAGMSRPALYLHFRSKEDIFRSLAIRYFDEAEADMRAALCAEGVDAEGQLLAAFLAKDGKFMDAVLGTPHGAELLDAGFRVSADIGQAGEARLTGLLAEWMARRPLPAGLGGPDDLAGTLMSALKGLKADSPDLPAYRSGQLRLARVFARAIGG